MQEKTLQFVKRCALEALKDADWMNRGFALRALAGVGEVTMQGKKPLREAVKEAWERLKGVGW